MFMDFLKEMYFHEIESREKIFSRIQFNILAYISVFSGIIYMVKTLDYDSECYKMTIFYVFCSIGCIIMLASIKNTVSALTGYKYTAFPLDASLSYRKSLIDHNKLISEYNNLHKTNAKNNDVDGMVDLFMSNEILQSININKSINEERKMKNHKAIVYFVYSLIPIALSVIVFVAFDLDASSPRKVQSIEDKNITKSIEKIDGDLKKLFPQIQTSTVGNNQNGGIISDVRKQ